MNIRKREVICARSAGFCFGVRRALNLAENALQSERKICSLGPLIHNAHVVEFLRKRGIEVIEELGQANGKPVIIRSHGATPEVFRQAQDNGIKIIDATCPFVTRIQRQAEDLVRRGYQVLIVGQPDHPEVQGILGWAGSGAVVIQSIRDLAELKTGKKIGILAQTTQNRSKYFTIVAALLGKTQELCVFDTICHASQARQEEAAEIARKADVMFVIGGRNSANTRQLVEICRELVTTYHIEDVAELEQHMVRDAQLVGVTAGASTPDWIIEEVIKSMTMHEEEMEKVEGGEVQENTDIIAEETTTSEGVAEETDAPEAAVEESAAEEQETAELGQEEMMNLDLGAPLQIQQGDIISGTVVQVRDDEVLLDIGGKSEGVIPRQELSLKGADTPLEEIQVGDVFDVYVLRVDNDEGHLILSKKRADRMKALDELEKAFNEKTELAGEVVRVVKGGLLVDVLGIRGFVPASLVELGYVGDLDQYLGKTLRLQVIEFDRNKAKIVLSQKAILQEERQKAEKELWEDIEAGQIRKGTVRHLVNFGAFVDLGGVDGLLHISELSWGRVKHPSEVVQEGDEIEVYVISVDRERKRISLSLKQAQGNPWDTVDERYQVGEVVTGKVMRLVSFGAFVQLEPGVEGLVHISRLADYHVVKPEDVVSAGEQVQVKILDINKQDQRISLSIKDVPSYQDEETEQDYGDSSQSSGNTGVGVNLGEVFGDLFTKAEQK